MTRPLFWPASLARASVVYLRAQLARGVDKGLPARDPAYTAPVTAERGFAGDVAAFESMLAEQRGVAVSRLRSVREAWGGRCLESRSREISSRRCVRWSNPGSSLPAQRAQSSSFALPSSGSGEIGTWASGSGEGLASMAEVRALQIAQAWLWAARGSADPGAVDKARALAQEARDDPNDIAAPHAAHIDALLRRVSGS